MRIVPHPAASDSIKCRDMVAAAVIFCSPVATVPVAVCRTRIVATCEFPSLASVIPRAPRRLAWGEIKKLSEFRILVHLFHRPHARTSHLSPSPLFCRARPPGTRWRCGCAPSSNRTCSPSAASSSGIPGRSSSSESSCSSASRWGSSPPGSSGASKSCGWKVSRRASSDRAIERCGGRRENGQLGNFHSVLKAASCLSVYN